MRESKNKKCDLSIYAIYIFLYISNMQSFPPSKKKKKKKKKYIKIKIFGKRSYFFLFFKQFFSNKKEKSRRPQKRKRAGTLNMVFCFTSPKRIMDVPLICDLLV